MSTSASQVLSFGSDRDTPPIPGMPNRSDVKMVSVRKVAGAGATAAAATVTAASAGTYDFSNSANRTLTVFFSRDNGASYQKMTISGLVGATPAATTAAEVAALLNADPLFQQIMVASNNAGTLNLKSLTPSSRFKSYYSGTACAILGTDFTTAIASGSAKTGSAQAGSNVQFIVEDIFGEPVPRFPVYISCDKSTGRIGLFSKGRPVGNPGEVDVTPLRVESDDDGTINFYFNDTTAETAVLTAKPGSSTTTYGGQMAATASVVFA